jgi:hypothetical protein
MDYETEWTFCPWTNWIKPVIEKEEDKIMSCSNKIPAGEEVKIMYCDQIKGLAGKIGKVLPGIPNADFDYRVDLSDATGVSGNVFGFFETEVAHVKMASVGAVAEPHH